MTLNRYDEVWIFYSILFFCVFQQFFLLSSFHVQMNTLPNLSSGSWYWRWRLMPSPFPTGINQTWLVYVRGMNVQWQGNCWFSRKHYIRCVGWWRFYFYVSARIRMESSSLRKQIHSICPYCSYFTLSQCCCFCRVLLRQLDGCPLILWFARQWGATAHANIYVRHKLYVGSVENKIVHTDQIPGGGGRGDWLVT